MGDIGKDLASLPGEIADTVTDVFKTGQKLILSLGDAVEELPPVVRAIRRIVDYAPLLVAFTVFASATYGMAYLKKEMK